MRTASKIISLYQSSSLGAIYLESDLIAKETATNLRFYNCESTYRKGAFHCQNISHILVLGMVDYLKILSLDVERNIALKYLSVEFHPPLPECTIVRCYSKSIKI